MGLSRYLIEYSRDIFQRLYDENEVDVKLEAECFTNSGDTLYALYDSKRYSRDEAIKLIQKRYYHEKLC